MKLIILDRDGVINQERSDYIKHPDEWVPIIGSLEAIARLTKAGYTIAVATNQSGVARGLYTLETLEKIHQKMLSLVEKAGGRIDKLAFCPHHPREGCSCRKPAPGLLLQIAEALDCALTGVIMIGDRYTDVLAAEAVGAKPILVESTFLREDMEILKENHFTVPVYANLAEAVDVLLREQ